MSSVQDIDWGISDVFGVDTPRTVDVHSSGAVSIVVRAGERVIVIGGTATHAEWGISVDPDDDAGFSGHPKTVGSLADALRSAHAGIHS